MTREEIERLLEVLDGGRSAIPGEGLVALCRHALSLMDEMTAARKAVFMPSGYPASLAEYLTTEVWPMPRTEDVEKILMLESQLVAKDAAYTALLTAAEACRKGREEAERERDELRKILEAAEGR